MEHHPQSDFLTPSEQYRAMQDPEFRQLQQQRLVDRIRSLDLPDDQYVITGSAAIVLHGLRIFDPYRDYGTRDNVIDVIVDCGDFSHLAVERKTHKIDRLGHGCYGARLICPSNGQAYNVIDTSEANIPGLDFLSAHSKATLATGDKIPILDLVSLLRWNRAMNGKINRIDAHLIERYRTGQAIARLFHRNSSQ